LHRNLSAIPLGSIGTLEVARAQFCRFDGSASTTSAALSTTQQPQPLAAKDDSFYDIQDRALIKTHDGATLSATVVRKKGVAEPQPTLLTFDIYTDPEAYRACGKEPQTEATSA
jgi:hypothetical protein